MLFNDKTPIIAIATAPGRGGIGVIRLSFEADLADPILAALFPQRSIEPRRVQLLPFLDENNALLDHAVVLISLRQRAIQANLFWKSRLTAARSY